MNAQFTKHGSEGFTLVELLVTILIIVILSVTMLPLLKPFVTQAQYSAEGVPVIGNIRTKVELFRIENDYLPGVPVDSQGKVLKSATYTKTIPPADPNDPTSQAVTLAGAYATTANGGVAFSGYDATQWMKPDDTTRVENYYIGFGSAATETAAAQPPSPLQAGISTATETGLGDHVWKRISVNYSDLTGKKLRPDDMQYTVIMSDGDTYYWVIACFGQGNGGLASGCGYAVAEYNNPGLGVKFVATFENYKPVSSTPLKINVDSTSNGRDIDLANGDVWLPNFTDLLTLDVYKDKIGEMRTFGWQVN